MSQPDGAALTGTARRPVASATASASRLLLGTLVLVVLDLRLGTIDVVHDAIGYALAFRAAMLVLGQEPPSGLAVRLRGLQAVAVVGAVVAVAASFTTATWPATVDPVLLLALLVATTESLLAASRWVALDAAEQWWSWTRWAVLVIGLPFAVVVVTGVSESATGLVRAAAALSFLPFLAVAASLLRTSRAGDAWRTTAD